MRKQILFFFITILLFLFVNSSLKATPANLLTNPGAESGLLPWTTFGSSTNLLQASSAQSHSGTYSLFITGRTQYYHGPNYNIKSFVTGGQLVSGQRYTFSVWVRHAETSAKTISLNLKKVDNGGTNYLTLENEVVPPNTWVKIESHYILTITGTLASLDLYVITSNPSNYSFYTDDFYVGELEAYTPPVMSTSTDFIRASGKNLVVTAANTQIVLKGINIGIPTDATDTPQDIWDVKSVSEKDFQNIASLGFNAIRLMMNYKMFEDDALPGVFKEDGWHWLDRAISMAKTSGLKIMLDMHAPQGGYQSDQSVGFSAFWGTSTSDPNTANQNRLLVLWTAIANRYKHETEILGFDLINEPRPHNSEEWFSYSEQLIAQIRTVDANHLIVVEAPLIPGYTFRTVNDANVLYDSHFYYTWGYVTQYSAAYGKGGVRWGKYDPENPIWVNSSETVVPAGTLNAVPFDKSYLEDILIEDILEFASDNNVPVNVGEYGICWESFGQDVGAIRYLYDLDEIFDGDNSKSMQVSRFYFAYQYPTFGLYTNWFGFQPNETAVSANLKSYFKNDFRWSGTSGTSWDATANWNVGIKPGPTNNVTIETSSNQPHISNSAATPAVCNNLTIQAGSVLTIDAGKALTVNGALSNNAGAGGLTIASDAAATGSLISQTTDVSATVQRYIGGAGDDLHGWHFLSSPVADQAISAFHTAGSGNDFYKWDEPTKTWINRTAAGGSLNGSFETDFVVGRGYLMANQSTSTKSFTGFLNVENMNMSGLTNSGGSYSGWHLLANPFSSAIKFDQGSWNKVNIAAYAQVWNETSASYKIVSGNQLIPAMNGFMIYTTGNGSLTIPADARVHSDSAWYKSSVSANEIILTARDFEGKTAQETIISFKSEATEGFDLLYDSFFAAGFAPMFFSISQNEKFALSCLPAITDGLAIPLGFIKNGSNNFSIELTRGLEDVVIFLTDTKTGTNHNLSKNNYSFSSEASDNSDRFLLRFQTVGIHESVLSPDLNARVYDNDLYVVNSVGEIQVRVFDAMGRLMQSTLLSGSGQQKLPLNLASGIYLIRLFIEGKTQTVKAVVK